MSARSELLEEVIYGLKIGGYTPEGQEKAEANKLIDAFAHELAEKQREATVFDLSGGGCGCHLDYCEACEVARVIDSIDPLKESDRG